MYPRILKTGVDRSFFLFGPRGTGKSSWLKKNFKNSCYIDLLNDEVYRKLLSKPEELSHFIDPEKDWIIIDEVQRVPNTLNEVHRLIEEKSLKFILSGSSARTLKKAGINLLAGRAVTRFMYPFTSYELGKDFSYEKGLRFGMLPEVWDSEDNLDYLNSYITTYLKEEVQQEGLTRNLGSFSRFLEVASFSQSSPLNVANVARDVGIDNKTAENYFTILEDLLLAVRLPVFAKHAKREMYQRAKFFFFDVGVYRTLRAQGPLDTPEHIDGAALETLLFQEIRALNDYHDLGYQIYYWRTRAQQEVDLVLYGERGIIAIEIKRASSINNKDLAGLKLFKTDYPIARSILLYGGTTRQYRDDIELIPYQEGLTNILDII